MALIVPAHVVALQKAWQALSGFITALLVTQFLSTEEQGYYYAIGCLLSGYVLLDLGLSGLLVQISARMFSELKFSDKGEIEPVGDKSSAYLAMLAWSRCWYSRVSLIVLLLIPVGFIYFSLAGTGYKDIDWRLPLVLAVVSTALSMFSYSILSIIEGAGRIAEVYWIRLVHYALGAALSWMLIVGGNGLFALSMPALALAITTTVWFRLRYRGLLDRVECTRGFLWREEVWPLQKRVALSWLAGYAYLNAPVLMVFYYVDATAAGQLGLTVVVANVLGSLCASWLTAEVPRITSMISLGREEDSKVLFLYEFCKALLLMILGYILVIFLLIEFFHLRFVQRLLPPDEVMLLFAAFTIYHSVGMFSIYFRAKGKEELSYPFALSMLLSLIASCLIVSNLGVSGVLMVILGSFVVICIPAIVFSWNKP